MAGAGAEPAAQGAEEGEWISEIDEQRWRAFMPQPGDVLEIETSLVPDVESPAGYGAVLVNSAETSELGGVLIRGRYIGCDHKDVAKYLSNSVNRKKMPIHLCWDSPCIVSDGLKGYVHVRQARWWNAERFDAPYMQPWGRLVLKEFLDDDMDEEGFGRPKDRPPGRRRRDKTEKEKERDTEKKPGRGKDAKVPREGKKKKAEEEEEDSKREGLQRKLKRLRQQLLERKEAGVSEVIDLEGEESTEEAPTEIRRGVKEKRLVAGDLLRGPSTALALMDEPAKAKEKIRVKRKVKQKAEAVSRLPAEELLAQAAQAQQLAAEERRLKKREKEKGKDSGKVRALVRLLEGKGSSKREKTDQDSKKKKKKGKRTRVKKESGGGDSSPSSSSDRSSGSRGERDEDEESSSSSELLAPLQKKSAKRPGAVLKMLVDHARLTMDQSSLVTTGSSKITGGVKLTSYFNLMIRPYHGSSSRDMKELHLLAACMDELRSGSLGKLGDSLASRFLAVHTAVNEGTWRSAQYLEIHPLEPAQGAPTSLLLEAQKHSKMMNKSRGQDDWGRRNSQADGWKWPYKGGDGKGKTKGGKGKEQGKGGRYDDSGGKGKWQNQTWRRNWWSDQKEKPDAKDAKGDKDKKDS